MLLLRRALLCMHASQQQLLLKVLCLPVLLTCPGATPLKEDLLAGRRWAASPPPPPGRRVSGPADDARSIGEVERRPLGSGA
jgi:hypothetical protein